MHCGKLIAAAFAVASCGLVNPSAFERRAAEHRSAWDSLSHDQRVKLKKGIVEAGMPAAAAKIARDRPVFEWDTTVKNKKCRGAMYASDANPKRVDLATYSCRGAIVKVAKLKPAANRAGLLRRAAVVNKKYLGYFEKLSRARQQKLLQGALAVGDAAQAFEIVIAKNWEFRWSPGGCDVYLYSWAPGGAVIDRKAELCDGSIAKLSAVKIPVAALRPRVKRVLSDNDYFGQLPRATQWAVLQGIVDKGQTARTVALAWGQPYRVEQGGARMVFTDPSGDYLGSVLTFAGGRVNGWKHPTKMVLTPEARDRKVANERARQAQLAAMQAYYAEQERMYAEQAAANDRQRQARQAQQQQAQQQQAQRRPQRRVIRVNNQRSSARRSLVIQGTTYYGGEHLGKPCSSSNRCPASYRCIPVVNDRGQCVQ